MSIQTIRMLNPNHVIHDIHDAKFTKYGRIVHIDDHADELIKYVEENIKKVKAGNEYIVDIERLHKFEIVDEIKHEIYGELAIECGVCHGHNDTLMGLEFHQGSEINIAVTDFVLAVARREDMNQNKIHNDQLVLFHVPKGSVIELYGRTLHYCPFSCFKSGFSCIVILLDKTNTAIENKPNQMLVKRNKWFIAHENNKNKIEAGNIVGLLGEAIKIKV